MMENTKALQSKPEEKQTSYGDSNALGDAVRYGSDCTFGNKNSVGDNNVFGDRVTFGNNNTIGDWNVIGNGAVIGADNVFGVGSWVGDSCVFGDRNEIGNWTTLGDDVVLGEFCILGHTVQHGKRLTISGVKVRKFMTIGNVDGMNRQVRVFVHTKGIKIECGCFSGTLDEFCSKAEAEGKKQYSKTVRAAAEAFSAALDEGGVTGGWEMPDLASSAGARSVAQYFYKNDVCVAESSADPACICWHDVGTGPFSEAIPGHLATEQELKLTWRFKSKE